MQCNVELHRLTGLKNIYIYYILNFFLRSRASVVTVLLKLRCLCSSFHVSHCEIFCMYFMQSFQTTCFVWVSWNSGLRVKLFTKGKQFVSACSGWDHFSRFGSKLINRKQLQISIMMGLTSLTFSPLSLSSFLNKCKCCLRFFWCCLWRDEW